MVPRLWPFKEKQDARLTYKTLSITASRYTPPWGDGMQPDLKRHFDMIERLRNTPASRQEDIACELVRLAPLSIRGFREEYEHQSRIRTMMSRDRNEPAPDIGPFRLPQHPGYQRLAINAEKAKDYERAITICREARDQGWAGDWDKRIERCQVKAKKGAI